jgi:hypothetical protein
LISQTSSGKNLWHYLEVEKAKKGDVSLKALAVHARALAKHMD